MLKFFLTALFATPVFAATYKVPKEEPLITIEIPDEWQAKEVGESLQANAPAEPLHVLIVPPEGTKIAETMGETMRYVRGSGGIVVKADTVKKEADKMNGLAVQRVYWLGKDKNGEVKIEFSIVELGQRKSVLIACWGPPKARDNHAADLKKMLQSIKPLVKNGGSEE